MTGFATFLHPQTAYTSRTVDQTMFAGYSYPHFAQVREALAGELGGYPVLPVREAEFEDYLTVHTPEYLDGLKQMAEGCSPQPPLRLSLECKGLEYCLPAYLYGMGGMLEAIDEMKRGTLDRAYCFSLGGHHAYRQRGHGYCLLNPLAAVARYAQKQGFARVLIADWDLHHGDGTQSIFAGDKNVYQISIHSALDLYMALACGWRYGTSTVGQQLGHCNLPVISRSFDDRAVEELNFSGVYYRAETILPAFKDALENLPWAPDLILIFSGYDAHVDDQGKDILDWTDESYRQLTRNVVDLAHRLPCPVLSVHGGGYNLSATISAAKAHVQVLDSQV